MQRQMTLRLTLRRKGFAYVNEYGRRATDIFQPVNDAPEDINYPTGPTKQSLLSSVLLLRQLVHTLFKYDRKAERDEKQIPISDVHRNACRRYLVRYWF